MSRHPKDPPPRYRARYPWREWFARRKFTIRKGKDFHCQIHGMYRNVIQAAARPEHGVHVSVSTTAHTLTVTVLGKLEKAT